MKNGAIKGQKEYGVLASISIAQAMLESGYGNSPLANRANNLFGIKAEDGYTGEFVWHVSPEWNSTTRKMVNVNSKFRKYNNWEESIYDHSKFFTSTEWRRNRYAKFLSAKDYRTASIELGKAGYATDPQYSTKLIRLIEQYGLAQYDKEALGEGSGVMSKSDRDLVIVGHGKKPNGAFDCGAVGNGYTENGQMQELIAEMKKYSTSIDYVTEYDVYSRGNIVDLARGYRSTTEFHMNAHGNTSANGTEVLIYANFNPDAQDKRIHAVGTKYFTDRGFKKHSNLGNMNAMANRGLNYRLVEVCFISNKSDNDKFRANMSEIAKAYVEAIEGKPVTKGDDTVAKVDTPKVEEPHWAEKHFKSLNDKGIVVHEKRFDDVITRGEVMALIDRATNK